MSDEWKAGLLWVCIGSGITGWVLNCIILADLVQRNLMNAEFVIRVVGVIFPPVGAVIGYF